MCINQDHPELNWISLILRVAMASLFLVAAVGKFIMGLGGTAMYFMNSFKGTFLPWWLVVGYAYVIPFAEALIVLWLLSGIRLRNAWIFTAFVLITLAFGMVVARQYTTASENYLYVMMSCLGVYLSRYDVCRIGGKKWDG